MPKFHRLMLDYDGLTLRDVEEDAEMLKRMRPDLGEPVIEQSAHGWHLIFPKSQLQWEEALQLAELSRCDKAWLAYCKKYKVLALETEVSKVKQPKVVNPPVSKITLPVILRVMPVDSFNIRSCIRLCESIKDKEWQWLKYTPVYDLRTRIDIGCRDRQQAIRRLKWLSARIEASFEVVEVEERGQRSN